MIADLKAHDEDAMQKDKYISDEQGQHEWQKQQVERPEYLKNVEQ
jgi:hypothetical protein